MNEHIYCKNMNMYKFRKKIVVIKSTMIHVLVLNVPFFIDIIVFITFSFIFRRFAIFV